METVIKSIYLIGSLRNENIPLIGDQLRKEGFDVFDEWFSAGPEADDYFKKYHDERGVSYDTALKGYAARHIFEFDKRHLDRCDIALLVLPAGKSAHLELGYAVGKGKTGYIYLDKIPERYDIMYQFSNGVFLELNELIEELKS